MSIQRDKNGYKVFDLPEGGQLLWAEEDQVLFARPNEHCTPLTTDFDDHYGEIMEGWEQAIFERNQAVQELSDYKAHRGENLGEMMDARAEADRLRRELEEVSNRSLERSLLEMWHGFGIKEIYKYKNRIKVYKREGLVRYQLFTDLTYRLFTDVEDTANYRDATPEDYKVRVEDLLSLRKETAC